MWTPLNLTESGWKKKYLVVVEVLQAVFSNISWFSKSILPLKEKTVPFLVLAISISLSRHKFTLFLWMICMIWPWVYPMGSIVIALARDLSISLLVNPYVFRFLRNCSLVFLKLYMKLENMEVKRVTWPKYWKKS